MPFNNRVCRSGLVFSLFALACLAPRVYADSAPMWTDRQLVDFSDVIVRGRVTRITVAQDERVGSLYTYVSLNVASVLKGSLSDRRVVLKQLGGRLGATELRIAGQPSFTVGEDVLVFLESRPRDRTLTVTAQWQGKFTVASDATGETATRDDPSGVARGIFAGQTRALASWLTELRREVAGTRIRASGLLELAPSVSDRATLDSTRTTAAAVWRDQMLAGNTIRLDMTQGLLQVQDGGERQLRQAANFWTETGIATLATGGLQPAGCFTARAPDGRITFGADACEELSPSGGTLAISGGWIQYDSDASGVETARFLGAGVITNRGETAARFLAQPACFDQLAKHELGHALGLIDSPDGSGVMAPALNCEARSGLNDSGSRPTFVPLDPGVRPVGAAADRDVRYAAVACKIGCEFSAATAVSAPNPPTNLSASLSGLTLTLTWTAPATDQNHLAPTSYTIEEGTTTGGTEVLNYSTGNAATTFQGNVPTSTTLYVRVRATNTFGASDPSAELVVVVPAGPPPAPTVPSAPQNLTFSQSGSTVTINWTAPTSGDPPTTYQVEAGSSSGTVDVANISTGSTAPTFSATVGGTAVFYVRVRARNATGTSAASNEVIIAIGGAPLPPGAPSGLAATAAGSSVALSWNAPTTGGPIGTYIIQAGSTQGTSNLANFSTGSTLTTFSTTGVPSGTYFVRVLASNASGTGPASNEIVVIIVN